MANELDRILENIESAFMPQLKQAFGGNLKAVILYGSAIKGTFTDKMSDINVLVLLENADPDAVIEFGKTAGATIRKNRISPLLLTENEFIQSADVFPLEYMDISDSRKVLFGDDPTAKLEITRANLRHQVETQLRGTVADLRRALLGSKGKSSILTRYLKGWFGSQNALLRGLLRLGGATEIPADTKKTVELLADIYGIDAGSLETIAGIRLGEKTNAAHAAAGALRYFTELAAKIDSMDV